MSKYGQTQTVLREEKFLVGALKAMGFEVEVHPEGAQLNSYYAEQEAKAANVVIRRQHANPFTCAALIKPFPRASAFCRLATPRGRA
jgi:hypothetical protein